MSTGLPSRALTAASIRSTTSSAPSLVVSRAIASQARVSGDSARWESV